VISRRCSDPPVRDLGRGQFPQPPGYPAPWRHLRQRLGKNVPDGAPGTGPGGIAGRYSVSFVAVNAEQAEDWNGASGRHFIEQRERWERMRGRLTARLLAAARIQDGENVLDIGCGCGDTTVLAARAAGSGHALGADFSRIQVAEARRLAAAAGVANARFEVADAQVHPFGAGSFDVVLSTFGVMFFDDPAAAFGNLRKALRRGGRLAFLCWRTRDENPCFTIGFAGAAAVLGLREMPGPDAAFSLAGTGWAGALLSGAGFGGIEFAKADEPMLIGRDVDDVLEYERTFPSASEVLTGLSPAQAAELTRQVRDRLAAYASPGGVTMPGAAWLVTARAG
jgi:SAM-dependent methyltransferase